jgi:hypothetical protein
MNKEYRDMSFQGTGTATVSYQIGSTPLIQATGCKVTLIEDSSAGTVTMNVSFTDPDLGVVAIGMSILNYSPKKNEYSVQSMEVVAETPAGGWGLAAGGSAALFIHKSSVRSVVTYNGFFYGLNLEWLGEETQPPFNVDFSAFILTVAPAEVSGLYYVNGRGTGSLTYTFGGDAQQKSTVALLSTSFYDNAVIYAVQLQMYWPDPVQGSCMLFIQVDPFTGTGSYNYNNSNVSLLLWSAAQSPGNWECGYGFEGVSLDAIYSQVNNVNNWQGTLVANNLPRQDGPQPPVNLDLSALTLTVTEG